MSTRLVGLQAEVEAKKYLIAKKLVFLEANYNHPAGEIDLIFLDPEALQVIFVEVKARQTNTYGEPELAVTPYKLGRIRRSARYYLEDHPQLPQFGRIDVVAITYKPHHIEHFINVDL